MKVIGAFLGTFVVGFFILLSFGRNGDDLPAVLLLVTIGHILSTVVVCFPDRTCTDVVANVAHAGYSTCVGVYCGGRMLSPRTMQGAFFAAVLTGVATMMVIILSIVMRSENYIGETKEGYTEI